MGKQRFSFFPSIGRLRGHHGCDGIVDKVPREGKNADGTQKVRRKRSMGEEQNKKENRALTGPKLRGTGQRAIDWMNDLIKYFPLQCIVGFFLITKKLDLTFACVTY